MSSAGGERGSSCCDDEGIWRFPEDTAVFSPRSVPREWVLSLFFLLADGQVLWKDMGEGVPGTPLAKPEVGDHVVWEWKQILKHELFSIFVYAARLVALGFLLKEWFS